MVFEKEILIVRAPKKFSHLTAQAADQQAPAGGDDMAANPVATDSAAELKEILGDDSTATFESDPKFIDSAPTDNASSENIEVQRDTDDTEDSEEEDDESDLEDEDEDLEDEGDDEDEDLEDEEEDDEDDEEDEDLEDDDDDVEDDGDEVGAVSAAGAAPAEVRSETEGEENVEPTSDEDLDGEHEGAEEAGFEGDSRQTDRAVDAALRMRPIVAAEVAANV